MEGSHNQITMHNIAPETIYMIYGHAAEKDSPINDSHIYCVVWTEPLSIQGMPTSTYTSTHSDRIIPCYIGCYVTV